MMALSGAVLLLFVTFHCVMNAVAICWPAAYNTVCAILGANWYALIASAGLALFVLIHICYAVLLTVKNYKARGSQRYAVSVRPKSVEWSSKNMLVLGIVILAFLVVHLIQFWAKMQLREMLGCEEGLPPAAGTLFLQEAFSQIWTPIVYVIGFVALWFHLNHGFWSMFQSIGWDNNKWIPRLKCIGCWWVSIVCLCFVAQAVVFTVRANEKYYLTNETLREQYKDMLIPMVEEGFGAEGKQLAMNIEMANFQQVSDGLHEMERSVRQQIEGMNSPEAKEYLKSNPEFEARFEQMKKQAETLKNCVSVLDYIESGDNTPRFDPEKYQPQH